jgi:ABC-type uncharacterized transport system permease subunit
MFSGVEIVCFAGSYAVVLLLELSRLLFRSGARGAAMVGIAAAGLVAHTAYLYYRAVKIPGAPLSNAQDWCMAAAWVLIVVYLFLLFAHPRVQFGLFLLPLSLGLILAGKLFARDEFTRAPASEIWGAIHAASIALAAVAVLVGFSAGMMYFAQSRWLKEKLPPARRLQLPSLEWLITANQRSIIVSAFMLCLGVASGVILNLMKIENVGGPLPWDDPLIISTLVLTAWLGCALVAGRFYKPAKAGRKVAFFTVMGFVFLVIALAALLSFTTKHGGSREAGEAVESGEWRVESGEWRVERKQPLAA